MPLNFIDLGDVPGNYTGAAGKGVRVKSDESGLEFVTEIAPSVQVSTYQNGAPTASQVILRYLTAEAWTLPANMTGSRIDVGTAPTATATLDVQRNGVSVGSIGITTGLSYSFSTTSGTSKVFAAGDILSVVAPSSPDATLAKIALTLTGPKN